MPYKIKKSYRKQGYDYSLNGYYFITICTKGRKHCFGKVEKGKMILSLLGKIAVNFWIDIPKHFKHIRLGEFIIMPNHVHGIIILEDSIQSMFNDYVVETGHRTVRQNYKSSRTGQCPVPTEYKSEFGHVKSNSISTIIGSFKSICTKIIHQKYPQTNFAWQPRFHDRIIRDEEELYNIQNYIYYNPDNWYRDRNNLEDLFM
ncbi:transposase [Patescibacteria group bacterium]